MEMNKKLNVVLDVDEVLTNISPIWVALMCKEYDYFSKYLNIPRNFHFDKDYYKVMLRPYFLLEKSYGNDYLNSLPKDEFDKFVTKQLDVINCDSFYTKLCEPTKLFKSIKTLMESTYFNKVYFVTRCLSDNKKGKVEFLERFLGKDNIRKSELHLLDLHEKKSDYINSLTNVDVIYDDELTNVIDIMKNCPMNMERGTDIMIPLHGYNIPYDEIFDLSDESGYKITYYEAIPGFNASTYEKVLSSN